MCTFTSISLTGVAFLLSDTQELLMAGEEQYSKRIQKFINIHRNGFLVLSAALHGPEEWNVMFRIQRRYDFNIETNVLLLGRNEVAVLYYIIDSSIILGHVIGNRRGCSQNIPNNISCNQFRAM